MIIVEIREQLAFCRSPLRFKVVQYEQLQDGSRIYYGSRSFEGIDAAQRYKAELEDRYRKEGNNHETGL